MFPEFNLDPPDPATAAAQAQEMSPEEKQEWDRHTRPMLEAFAHAKFMVEMAVRYADLPLPPVPMPSGWAALLYLYDLR